MPEVSSRPGPRTDLDARAVLIETAERLFGTEGVGAVSLRAIGRAADVSSAGVLYHFPTKEKLVEAVFRSRGELLGEQVRTNLAGLLVGDRAVTTRQVVDAVLHPMVAIVNDAPLAGLTWFKLYMRLAQTDDDIWVEAVSRTPVLNALFHDATSRALPDVGSRDVRLRVSIAMFSMLSSLASADLGGTERRFEASGFDPAFVEQLARFTAAGMAAG